MFAWCGVAEGCEALHIFSPRSKPPIMLFNHTHHRFRRARFQTTLSQWQCNPHPQLLPAICYLHTPLVAVYGLSLGLRLAFASPGRTMGQSRACASSRWSPPRLPPPLRPSLSARRGSPLLFPETWLIPERSPRTVLSTVTAPRSRRRGHGPCESTPADRPGRARPSPPRAVRSGPRGTDRGSPSQVCPRRVAQ